MFKKWRQIKMNKKNKETTKLERLIKLRKENNYTCAYMGKS